MNITVRLEDESVASLLKKLSDVDLNIIEIFDEDSRQKPNPGPIYRGEKGTDVASTTAAAARAAIQNG